MSRINAWINSPLRFRKDPRSYLKYVALFFLYLIVFLGFYQPFFLQFLSANELISIVIKISLFCAMILPSSFIIVSTFYKKTIDSWTFGKEAIWILGHFLVIGSYNLFLFKNSSIAQDISAVSVFVSTCFVGLIPAAIDVFLRLSPKAFNRKKSDVVYVKSDGNYIHVYQFSKGVIVRKVQRIPLNHFQQERPGLVQVHKSFLVNSSLIREIKGNSNGGKLMLIKDLQVPYSRGFYQNVKNIA